MEEVYQMIRKSSISPITLSSTNTSISHLRKILRMTKLSFYSEKNLAYNIDIISSNRYDHEFLECLKIEKVVWCINPLVKNYDEVKETLESMKNYVALKKTY